MIPPPLTRWQFFLYRIALPFRLKRQAIVRTARAQSALKGKKKAMNPQELFEQLSASVGPNYAADMVRMKFPDWNAAPRAKPMIGEDLHGRAVTMSTEMGSKALHKALWREHRPIMMHLGAVVP